MGSKQLLSIGHGFTAQEFGRFLLSKGWRVTGTTRAEDKAARLRETGVEAVLWPGSDLAEMAQTATHILVSAAPDADGDPLLNAYRENLMANRNLKWIGYLSTTGVYGEHGGAWVDEDTPVEPTTR